MAIGNWSAPPRHQLPEALGAVSAEDRPVRASRSASRARALRSAITYTRGRTSKATCVLPRRVRRFYNPNSDYDTAEKEELAEECKNSGEDEVRASNHKSRVTAPARTDTHVTVWFCVMCPASAGHPGATGHRPVFGARRRSHLHAPNRCDTTLTGRFVLDRCSIKRG